MNKNQGFSPKYAAILLVLAVAASAATILLSRSNEPAQQAAVEEAIVENMAESTQSTPAASASVASVAPADYASSAGEAKATEAIAVQDASQEIQVSETAPETALPVSGNAIGEYAMDCLSYNETTRDWRTHNGIDLAADEGENVCAAANGTVYTTYEDDSLGYTVVIRHDGGYTTRYSSLREDICVQPGDEVTIGQTIGYASDTALVETAMGTHIHFSVSCQDESIDPVDFLNLG